MVKFVNFACGTRHHAAAGAESGETPAQVHCGEVARTLADLNASESCVAAALLHSALDAGMLTEQALREAMPCHVADTVCNVSKLASICQARAHAAPLSSTCPKKAPLPARACTAAAQQALGSCVRCDVMQVVWVEQWSAL